MIPLRYQPISDGSVAQRGCVGGLRRVTVRGRIVRRTDAVVRRKDWSLVVRRWLVGPTLSTRYLSMWRSPTARAARHRGRGHTPRRTDPVSSHPHAEDRVLIGPDRSGKLLQVVVIDPEDDPALVHTMPLRRKFYDYL